MSEIIQLGDIKIELTRPVHPPSGRVTLIAPAGTRQEVARAFAISKLGWIREQQSKLRGQAREVPRKFIERESHDLWGRRHLLTVRYREAKPSVTLDHRRCVGHIRLNTELVKKPRDLLEYVIVHEMLHLIEPTHSERFVSLLDDHYPGWREARAELNELPLGAETWPT